MLLPMEHKLAKLSTEQRFTYIKGRDKRQVKISINIVALFPKARMSVLTARAGKWLHIPFLCHRIRTSSPLTEDRQQRSWPRKMSY